MPVYKDENRGTWYCKTTYTDWQGKRCSTTKRGFSTKREALAWEHEFQTTLHTDLSMVFESFVEVYFGDKAHELKERSLQSKRYMVKKHILPFFKGKKMNQISSADIINWQKEIKECNYSATYERMLQNQVTALFAHASNIYGLKNNPCKRVKKIGKSDVSSLNFWTKEEYDKFLSTLEEKDKYRCLFQILFWTGIREGECLALCKKDIDFVNNVINIDKTYFRSGGQDIITTPKTENSIRKVYIPEFLAKEIKDYLDRLYEWPDDARIFPVVAEAVQHKFKRNIAKAGVKKIRVHDLRHSHVAYLIHQGVDPLLIKSRLGHADIRMTLNTYGHLYPDEQENVARMLDERR